MQPLHGEQPPDGRGRDEEGVLRIHLGNDGNDGGNLIHPYHGDGLKLILSVYL